VLGDVLQILLQDGAPVVSHTKLLERLWLKGGKVELTWAHRVFNSLQVLQLLVFVGGFDGSQVGCEGLISIEEQVRELLE